MLGSRGPLLPVPPVSVASAGGVGGATPLRVPPEVAADEAVAAAVAGGRTAVLPYQGKTWSRGYQDPSASALASASRRSRP